MRGFVPQLIALGVGLIAGAIVGTLLVSMMKIRTETEMYAEGFRMLSLPYRAELLKIYANESLEEIINESSEEFLKKGAIYACGFTTWDKEEIAIWKNESSGCDINKIGEEKVKEMINKEWERTLKRVSSSILAGAAAEMGVSAYLDTSKIHVILKGKSTKADVGMNFTKIDVPKEVKENIEETMKSMEKYAKDWKCIGEENITLCENDKLRFIIVKKCSQAT